VEIKANGGCSLFTAHSSRSIHYPLSIIHYPLSIMPRGLRVVDKLSRYIVEHARHLARACAAQAVIVYADVMRRDKTLQEVLRALDVPTILVTRLGEPDSLPGFEMRTWVNVPNVHMTRAGQVKAALLMCMAHGVLQRGDRVVCLTGGDNAAELDGLVVVQIGRELELFSYLDSVAFAGDVAPAVFERTLVLATQLAIEGREGRPVGTIFVLGDSKNVLAQSRSLVLNPFQGHPEEVRNILHPELAETIKEFAALDGAFIVRGDGVVLTAGTQLVPSGSFSALPGGFGTRHAAAAGITASTSAAALCVSQSTGTVTVFKSGQMVTDIQRSGTFRRVTT
jgi:diadenylate cyclase